MILSHSVKLYALLWTALTPIRENKLHLVLFYLKERSSRVTYHYNFKALWNFTHIWQAILFSMDHISIYTSGNETLIWLRHVTNLFSYSQDLKHTLKHRKALVRHKSKWTWSHAYQKIAIWLYSMLIILLHFNRSTRILGSITQKYS